MRLRPRLALLAMLAVAAPFVQAPAMPAYAQEAAADMPPMPRPRPDPDSLAVILFTSGTEGAPKGVALSHANILSNAAQVLAHIALSPEEDLLLNPLPVFHCFGLSVGTILPLVAGIKVVSHPTPLQPKEIVKRIKDHGITILLSTDTFIGQYARTGEPGDLDTVRLAVCGAERVRGETRAFVKETAESAPPPERMGEKRRAQRASRSSGPARVTSAPSLGEAPGRPIRLWEA